MSGQINLYNRALRRQRDWLSARVAGAAVLGSIVLLALIGGYGSYAGRQTAVALSTVQAQLKAEQAQLTALQQSLSARLPDSALVQQVAQERALVAGRKDVLAALEGGAIGSSKGFSDYLRGLARQSLHGLWLTGLEIGAGGQDLEIRGRMLNQSALPEYIRRLNLEPAFKGHYFAALDMRGMEVGAGGQGRSEVPAPQPAPAVPPAAAALLGMAGSLPAPVTPAVGAPGGEKGAVVRYVEFVLRSREAPQSAEGKQ